MIKKVTSFTQHETAEGTRLTFTYSKIDEDGNVVTSNERGTTIVLDNAILDRIKEINDFLYLKIPE